MRPIGWYVHHQGAGHADRARRVAAHLARPCTLIGTGLGALPGAIDLPDDRLSPGFDGADGSDDRPEAMHYAPLGHPGIRARTARIARWIEDEDPVLLVVDVSVEIALLARLMALPTLVVRLAGLRTDQPHLEAFRAAERLLAPFPEALEDRETPAWVRAKTVHAGFLGDPAAPAGPRGEDVVVLLGRGGDGPRLADLAAAARAVPERRWRVLGEVRPDDSPLPSNLRLHGWTADVAPHLARAGLAVAAAGDGAVAAIAASGAPFLCLPEPRPYEEQVRKAAALERLGAAVVHPGWQDGAAWPGLVARALRLDPARLAALAVPDAAARLAAEIERIAARLEARPRPG